MPVFILRHKVTGRCVSSAALDSCGLIVVGAGGHEGHVISAPLRRPPLYRNRWGSGRATVKPQRFRLCYRGFDSSGDSGVAVRAAHDFEYFLTRLRLVVLTGGLLRVNNDATEQARPIECAVTSGGASLRSVAYSGLVRWPMESPKH